MLNAVTDVPWIGTWLKGQAELNAQNYANAASTFKTLDSVNYLKDNSAVLVNIAYCYNFMYDEKKAISCLQRVSKKHPIFLNAAKNIFFRRCRQNHI